MITTTVKGGNKARQCTGLSALRWGSMVRERGDPCATATSLAEKKHALAMP